MKPLRDKVVVMRLEEEEKKVGGIIIPDTAKEKPMQGKVVAVGPGATDKNGKRIPMELKKGDRVLFGKYSGTEVSIDGKEYLIMDASDIYAIIG
jgi:chaperonin GroES